MYINIHTYICVCIYTSSGTKVHSTRQKEGEREREREKESVFKKRGGPDQGHTYADLYHSQKACRWRQSMPLVLR